MRELSFAVIGAPAGQGNHRTSQSGHIYETTKQHRPWRDAVTCAAREAMTRGGGRISGPVRVSLTVTVRKPKSAPKKRRTWPDTRPDLSKYLRSIEDAIVTAGAIEDDSKIIGFDRLEKVYPGEGVDSLDVPGCVVRIRAVERDLFGETA